MRNQRTLPALCGLTAILILAVVGTAWGADTQKFKGLIVGRDGPNMIVKHQDADITTTVTLDDSTKVQAIKGKFGLRREDMGFTALIPGLPVEVEVDSSSGQTIAKVVKFKASELKTANMIQAGLTPTKQDVAAAQADIETNKQGIEANKQANEANAQDIQAHKEQIAKLEAENEAMAKRFGELGEYDVKGEATVMFAVNSSAVNEKGRQDLKALADQAKQIKSYMIHIAGYTDSSGNADYNQQLSDKRALAVTKYLQTQCGIPLYRVLAPDAMGEAQPAGSNETAAGKSANRRVEVKILVNRGVAGTS
ncbi:MAG TPA: OmpA family protein [Terriglobia bacterium]|nr:OmpA family protein [Terriglobia bacterium]